MAPFDIAQPNRRQFLKGTAAASLGLTVGFTWIGAGRQAAAAADFAPNAFVRIAPDSSVTIISKHLEMGQGSYTGIATILAEELDADWSKIRVESAPANVKLYANTLFGIQGTGGSTAMANSWEQLRKAGATARAMLVAAAAVEWQVPAREITVSKGIVSHAASKHSASFGALAAKAATMPPPDKVELKQPKDFKLIGTVVPRKDASGKINGTALFTIDVKLPEMVVALIQRAPRFGATVKSVDAAAARAISGVLTVVEVPTGVAVIGKNFWAAKQGRDALKVEWDESKAEKRGSAQLLAEYKELARSPGLPARTVGDIDTGLSKSTKRIEAAFEFPYLAHAPMEPLDCVVRLTGTECEIWAGSQLQTVDQGNAALIAGLKPENITIYTLFAGGSFGRRANFPSDFISEGVAVAKALGSTGVPVKLMWTREDDIQGGRYRPAYYHTLEAGLDDKGRLVAWKHRIVGQSIMAGTPFAAGMVKEGVDDTSVEGASTLPYAIPNLKVELHTTEVGVTVLWWRSVGSTHTAYSTEVFMDEVAHAAGQDPVAFRRALLKNEPRYLGVLTLVAAKSGWGKPLPPDMARGVAVHKSFGTFVAQVAEVKREKDGNIKVVRVVSAVDCGVAINPDVIKAQIEGGIGFGLGAAEGSAITLKDGVVEQANFDGYQVLRIDRMPKVEVHIVKSAEPPTGIGEPGVPPVGPAVANAIFALTGKRHRSLPFSSDGNA